MNVTGQWRGEYSYDEDEEISNLPARPIPYELTLKQHWFGIVGGTVEEDKRNGFAEPGKIHGKFQGDKLRFTKHFPKLRIMHEGRNETLEAWAERWKMVLDDPDEPHPTIHCIGSLSADGQTMAGTWLVKEVEITIPGARGPLRLPQLSGTFTMKRA